MSNLVVRTIIIYLLLLFFMRIMGKRELGQLSTSDFVVSIVIAELAAIPMEDANIPLMKGVFPIAILACAQLGLSLLCLKNNFFRRLVYGEPNILISKGVIQQKEMQKARYNIDDLLTQLREQNVFNISDVEYAILETSGNLTVMVKPEKRALNTGDMNLQVSSEGLPITLIDDGEVNMRELKKLNLDTEWLKTVLAERNIKSIKNVFFANITEDGNIYIVEREEKRSK